MIYYLFETAPEGYRGILLPPETNETLCEIQFGNGASAIAWNDPKGEVVYGEAAVGDFYPLANMEGIPVLSERAAGCLSALTGDTCELLPIILPDESRVLALRIRAVVPCLDMEKSVYTVNKSSGHINRVRSSVLKSSLIPPGCNFFRTPIEQGAEAFYSGAVADAIERGNLKGLVRHSAVPLTA